MRSVSSSILDMGRGHLERRQRRRTLPDCRRALEGGAPGRRIRPVGARTGVPPVQLNGKQEGLRIADASLTCAAPATVGGRAVQ